MKKIRETKTRYKTAQAKISLDKELVARLRQAAEWKGIAFEQAALNAVTEYIGRIGFEKIKAEKEMYDKMRENLLIKYRGQYVAVHQGRIIAHAPDLRSLRVKVFPKFGHTPILHILVTDEPERDLIVRSPRLVRE